MLGYARLHRATIIVEIMPGISRYQWHRFADSLALSKKIEFNPGEVGFDGGLQTKELASANPTTVDTIRRFGGSTSREIQWPEEDMMNQGEDRFDRLEKLIEKSMRRITKSSSGNPSRAGASGSSLQKTGSSLKESSGSGTSEASGADE